MGEFRVFFLMRFTMYTGVYNYMTLFHMITEVKNHTDT